MEQRKSISANDNHIEETVLIKTLEKFLRMNEGKVTASTLCSPIETDDYTFVRRKYTASYDPDNDDKGKRVICWSLECNNYYLKAKDDGRGLEFVKKSSADMTTNGTNLAQYLFKPLQCPDCTDMYAIESLLFRNCFLNCENDTSTLTLKYCCKNRNGPVRQNTITEFQPHKYVGMFEVCPWSRS